MANYQGFKITLSKGQAPEEMGIKQANFSPSEGFNPTNQAAMPQQPQTKKSANMNGAIAAMMAKKAIQYGIQNYGNLTGDYVTQANISGLIEVGGLVATAATGPIGVVAALSSVAIQVANLEIERAKQRQQVQFMRERTGTMINSRGVR